MPNTEKAARKARKRATKAIKTFENIFASIPVEYCINHLDEMFHLAMTHPLRGDSLHSQEIDDDFFWWARMKDVIRASGSLAGVGSKDLFYPDTSSVS